MTEVGRADFVFNAKEFVTDTTKKINSSIKTTEGVVNKSGKGMQSSFINLQTVANAALGFGIADLSIRAADSFRQFVIQGVSDAIALERAYQALEFQIGETADVFINDLRKATNNTVSDIDLLRAGNRALGFGIKQELIPALAETARALSKIQGTSTESAFNDIVVGISRASPLILDNLGIVLDADKVYKEYAESIGTTTDRLSKQQRQLALTTSIIEEYSAVTNALNLRSQVTADTVEQVSAHFKNIGSEIGNSLIVAMGELVDIFSVTIEELASADSAFVDSSENIKVLADGIVDLDSEYKNLINDVKAAKSAISDFTKGFETEEERQVQEQLNKLKLEQLRIEQAIKVERDGSFEILDTKKLNELKNITFDLGDGKVNTEDVGIIEVYNSIIQKQEELKSKQELLSAEERVLIDEMTRRAEERGAIERTTIADNLESVKEKFEIELANYEKIDTAIASNRDNITKLNTELENEKKIREEILKVTEDQLAKDRQRRQELSTVNLFGTNFTAVPNGQGGFGSSILDRGQ